MENVSRTKNQETMKKFYQQSGILVYEWESFELAILQGTFGFMLSKDQWNNRRSGRTKVSDSERIAMMHVLEQLRQKQNNQ